MKARVARYTELISLHVLVEMNRSGLNATIDPPLRSPRPVWIGYAIAVGGTGLVFALRFCLDPVFAERLPLMLFSIPAILATWYGGYKPGLAALFLGFILGACFFMGLGFPWGSSDLAKHINAFTYLVVTTPVIAAIGALQRTERRLKREMEVRKRTAMALQESEESFRALTEAVPAIIFTCDREGNWTYVTQQFYEYSGLPPGSALGQGWSEALHPSDRVSVFESWTESIRAGQPWLGMQRQRMVEGNYRWFASRCVPVTNATGEIIKWVGTATDVDAMIRAEKALAQAAEQQKKLSHQLFESQETERRRIARELHDQIGQSLSLLQLHLHALQLTPPPGKLAPQLKECSTIVEQVMEQVQKLSLDLRPTMLDDLGLIPALRWYINQARTIGLNAVFMSQPKEMRLDPMLETTCYRIVQEALRNVIRHAKAKWVCVDLRQSNGQLFVTISDNGVGFDPAAVRQKAGSIDCLGLLGMEERAALVGGEISFRSIPDHGTEVHVRFPLQPKEAAPESEPV